MFSVPLLIVMAACGGGSPADPGNTTNPPGGDTSTTVTLTITSRSLDAGYAAGPIFTYIGTVTETRARMPLLMSENSATVRPAGESTRTTTILVPKGRFVTLFATELGRAGFNPRPPGTVLSKVVPVGATEFVGWSGAPLGQPEAGVATIKMDANATVIAEYRKMEGLTFAYLGCPELTISAAGPGHLGFGVLDPNAIAPIGGNYGNSPVDYDYFYLYAKQGTSFTFTARKYEMRSGTLSETGFRVWGGAASRCDASLTCSVTVPPFGAGAATVRSTNSYLANATVPSACGGCDTAVGCTLTLRP